MDKSIKVGTITIRGPRLYHFNGYETASWWTDYALEPGTYEVRAYQHGGLRAKVPATVFRDFFVARLFQHSINQPDQHLGNYSVISLPLSKDEVDLDPGWTIVWERVESQSGNPAWAYWAEHLMTPGGDDLHMVLFLINQLPSGINEDYRAKQEDLLAQFAPQGRPGGPL